MRTNRSIAIINGMFLFATAMLVGCGEHGVKSPPSTDSAALRAIVKLPIPFSAVRWEVFNYPEKDGGFMSNIDSTTLIAEIEPTNPQWFSQEQDPIQIKWLNSNDSRSWISSGFRTMLSAEKLDVTKYKCKKYQTIGMTTGKKIVGFVCELDGRILLYLTLDENT